MKRLISIALVSGMSLTMTAVATSAQPSTDATGHWEGTINTPDQALVVVVDVARQENGTWIGTISVPSQGLKGFALSPMNVEGNTATFGMKGIPGDPMFKGTIAADPRTIAGDFTQGGATMPFTLAWKGEPKIEPPPKSSPISKELEGSWQGTLNVQGNTLRLVLDLTTEAGSGRGDPDQSGSEQCEDPCRPGGADSGRRSLSSSPRSARATKGWRQTGRSRARGPRAARSSRSCSSVRASDVVRTHVQIHPC